MPHAAHFPIKETQNIKIFRLWWIFAVYIQFKYGLQALGMKSGPTPLYRIPRCSNRVEDIQWHSMIFPWWSIAFRRHYIVFHGIPLYFFAFQCIPWISGYSIAFHDVMVFTYPSLHTHMIPLYSTMFRCIPMCSMEFMIFNLPMMSREFAYPSLHTHAIVFQGTICPSLHCHSIYSMEFCDMPCYSLMIYNLAGCSAVCPKKQIMSEGVGLGSLHTGYIGLQALGMESGPAVLHHIPRCSNRVQDIPWNPLIVRCRISIQYSQGEPEHITLHRVGIHCISWCYFIFHRIPLHFNVFHESKNIQLHSVTSWVSTYSFHSTPHCSVVFHGAHDNHLHSMMPWVFTNSSLLTHSIVFHDIPSTSMYSMELLIFMRIPWCHGSLDTQFTYPSLCIPGTHTCQFTYPFHSIPRNSIAFHCVWSMTIYDIAGCSAVRLKK